MHCLWADTSIFFCPWTLVLLILWHSASDKSYTIVPTPSQELRLNYHQLPGSLAYRWQISRSWDFLAFITISAKYVSSVCLSVYFILSYPILSLSLYLTILLILFLWRTVTNTVIHKIFPLSINNNWFSSWVIII